MNDELERLMREATEHAPLPWYSGGSSLRDADDCKLCEYLDPPQAALIVAAVNALPELLAKVKRLEEALTTIADPAAYSHSLPSCCQHTFDDACELFSEIARAALNQETKHD